MEQHARFAVDSRRLIAVHDREQRALREPVRRAQRGLQRAYEVRWRAVAAPLRPDLSEAEVHLVVVAALAVRNATALSDLGVLSASAARCGLSRAGVLPASTVPRTGRRVVSWLHGHAATGAGR